MPASHIRLAAVDKMGSKALLFDSTHTRINCLDLPHAPHEVLLSPNPDTLWISIYGPGTFRDNACPGNEILEIDTGSWTVKRSLSISPYTSPHGLTLDRFGVLWTSCDPYGVVLAISPISGKVLDAVATGSFGTHWVLASPDGSKLFTSNKDDGFLTVIDPESRRATGTIAVPAGAEGLGFSPDGRWLFAATHRKPHVCRIDVQSERVIESIELHDLPWDDARSSHHMRLRCSLDGRTLAVAAYHWNSLVLVDCHDSQRQTTLKTGRGPMALAFHPDTPQHLYLSNHDEGTISIFDIETKQCVETFPGGHGVESMAFLPSTPEVIQAPPHRDT